MNEATANPALFFSVPLIPCGAASCGVPCRVEACARATKTFEAIRLIQLGARITLICQLTGIEKTVAKRLYRELTGTSPPPGQTPSTDAWYVESDPRMLQAAIVWRLYECLDRPGRSKARVLIYVYEAYRQLVRKPVLDLIRVAYVPRLVAMRKWQERLCEECHLRFLRPIESLNAICPGCRLYHRYRCRRCDTPLHVRPRGRRRWVCAKCRGVAIRKVWGPQGAILSADRWESTRRGPTPSGLESLLSLVRELPLGLDDGESIDIGRGKEGKSMTTRPSSTSVEDRLALLRESLLGRAREIKPSDPIEPTPMVVAIENIKEYDHNPRRERNEAYDRIKGSLRQRGFTGALPITRRPGEAEYMVAEGGNTVLHILKELCAETHDPRFYSVHCLFEPWKSESETLIAHLVENDARGELIFIDRARAVHELRELLEQEAGAPLSVRQLATLLRERGYSIDHTMIIRLHYAVEMLLPVIPMALRAGLGRDEVQQIRKLESILVIFLENRQRDTAVIEGARRWFLDCLGRHDGEYFSLDPVQQELEAQVAKLCGETIAKVRADFGLIEQTGKPGHDAPPPVPFNLPEPRPKSPREPDEVRPLAPERPGAMAQSPRELPQDVKSLRGRMWTLAMQLAQRHGLGECVLTCPKGCGFLVDLPEQPPFAGEAPGSAEEARCVMLWWMLAGLAEEWPHGYGVEMAPALGYLEDARIYPAIKAVAEGDDSTPLSTLVPRVSYPPSLAIVPRDLFAVLDDRDYERLIRLIDTRRGLQAHCRRIGKQRVWEL